MSPLASVDPKLLASFYEGISRPQRFAQGLQQIGERLDCERVSLRLWDRRGNWGCRSEASRCEGGWTLTSVDESLPEPALRTLVGKLEPGNWQLIAQAPTLKPVASGNSAGCGQVALCTRIALSQADALLSLYRSDSHWTPDQIARARNAGRALLPALDPIARQRQSAQQVGSLSAMLDSLRMPMLLVDSSQRALGANMSARGLFNLSGKTSSGKIVISLPGVPASQFTQRLRDACAEPAIGGVLPLPLGEHAAGAHLLVLPLRLHRTRLKPAVALVLVQGLATANGPAQQLLQHVYGLTPAEARLAMLILDGQSPGTVASVLQLSVTTVRSQLSAVLKKTGAQRQSDLVRRLAPLMLLEKDVSSR
jgi:DNA-binding CsgD family transcriptional regulator